MHDVYAGEGCCAHRMCVCWWLKSIQAFLASLAHYKERHGRDPGSLSFFPSLLFYRCESNHPVLCQGMLGLNSGDRVGVGGGCPTWLESKLLMEGCKDTRGRSIIWNTFIREDVLFCWLVVCRCMTSKVAAVMCATSAFAFINPQTSVHLFFLTAKYKMYMFVCKNGGCETASVHEESRRTDICTERHIRQRERQKQSSMVRETKRQTHKDSHRRSKKVGGRLRCKEKRKVTGA